LFAASRLGRLSLLAQFGVMSVIPIVFLGLALEKNLESGIRERALGHATQQAELVSRLAIQPLLVPADLSQGLSPGRVQVLDQQLRALLMPDRVARVKIWNQELRIVYSDDHDQIGRSFGPNDELQAALHGQTVSEFLNADGPKKPENYGERGLGELLEVYVPLQFSSDTQPAGAFEMYLPYGPVGAPIQRDTRRLYVVILAGLTLLYAALFPIVGSASRRLRRQAAENEYQARHDALTDLPNRILFRDRVKQDILTSEQKGTSVAVMIMDLDRFKEINDTLGHHNGDLLLQQIAQRLREVAGQDHTIARLGGDEFGVLLADVPDSAVITGFAKRLLEALERPFTLQGLALVVGGSIGIAIFPEHTRDADGLMQRADVAMYVAKAAHSGYQLYSAEADQHSPSQLELAAQLRRAIDNHELVVHYQPKADLRGGAVRGVEALVRWQHPQRGLLMPDRFISVAEQTGFIRPLALYVLDTALRQCSSWRASGLDLSVAVNISALNLRDVQLPDDVARLLNRWNLPPDSLELEITESTLMGDPIRAKEVLDRLSAVGVRVAIDDFGIGYSSLAYLRQLPVSEIKIDKSFVMNMAVNESDAVIVRSIIDLARNLQLRVIAEGVETEKVWRELAGLGCDLAQGYYLSRPVPAEQLTAWLREHVGAVAKHAA